MMIHDGSQDVFNGGRHAQAGELGGVVFAMRGICRR